MSDKCVREKRESKVDTKFTKMGNADRLTK